MSAMFGVSVWFGVCLVSPRSVGVQIDSSLPSIYGIRTAKGFSSLAPAISGAILLL